MAGNRAQRLSGINPLSYLGVEPLSPPLLVVDNRAPTTTDLNGFFVGSIWIVTPAPFQVWVLVSIAQHVATWIQLFPSASAGAVTKFATQTGTSPVFPDGAGQVSLAGTSIIPGLLTTSGGVNTVDFVVGGQVAAHFTTDDALTAIPNNNVLKVKGVTGSVLRTTTTAPGDTVTIGFTAATDLQVIGGVTAGVPTWQTLTSQDTSVTIAKIGNTIDFSATGAAVGATDFFTDVGGPAVVNVNSINIFGGSNISTDGATIHTVKISVSGTTNHAVQVGTGALGLTSLAVGTNGQVLLGSTGADPAFVTPLATAGGGGLTLVSNAGSLNYGITAPVSIANGGTNATSFATVDGTVIYNGTRLVTTATGTAGQVLTSNGAGVAPTYQPVGGGGGVSGTQAFFAYLATTHIVDRPSPSVLNYTIGTEEALVELFDNGSNFFPGDGVGTGAFYTAPFSGVYQFTWQLWMISAPSGVGSTLPLLHPNMNMISTALTYSYGFPGMINFINIAGTGGFAQVVTWNWTVLALMTSGDTMEWNVQATSNKYTFEGSDNLGGPGLFIQGYRVA